MIRLRFLLLSLVLVLVGIGCGGGGGSTGSNGGASDAAPDSDVHPSGDGASNQSSMDGSSTDAEGTGASDASSTDAASTDAAYTDGASTDAESTDATSADAAFASDAPSDGHSEASAPTLVSIDVTPTNPSIAAGTTKQLAATGTYSDNSTQNLTSQVTWSSGTTSSVTVGTGTSAGLATGVATGMSTITASLDGVMGSTVVTVTAAQLVSIGVTPGSPTVAKGSTQQFTATGVFSDTTTQDLTTQVTWASGTAGTATISNASGTQGLATSLATGTTSITASLGNITSPAVTFTVTSATLVSIAVTPPTPSVAKGSTQQFTATGTYTDSTTQDLTTEVTWASGTPATATISNASGTQGLATSLATGTTSITATLGSLTSPGVTLTVTSATLVSIAVTPANPTIAKGLTQQFVATGTYSDTSTQILTTQVTWSSGTPATATISNASGSQGLATGVATGTSSITATLGSVTSPAQTLTVTSATLVSIAVTPASPTIALGLTQQFVATGTYTDTSTQILTTQVTWSSGTPATATISNASGSQGLATSLATGTTSITATLGSVTSPGDTLTVSSATLVSIAVTPASPSIAKGLTQQFVATGTYTDTSTQILTTQVTWASGTGATASISNASGSQGLATGLGTGTSSITATLGSVTSPGDTLTVTAPTLVSIAVTPASPSVFLGQTQQFAATGTYTDTSTQILTTQVTWASGTGATASISNASGSQGLATGLGTGTSSITATLGSVTSPGDTLTVSSGYVLHFGGGIVNIAAAATLNDENLYTLEGWISEDSPGGGGYQGLISQDFGGCCIIRMLITPSLTPFVNAGAHDDVTFPGFTFTVPAWHHWAMTCSGGTSTSWIDGNSVGTTPCIDPGNMSTATMYLGAGEGGGPYRLTGRIAEVRVSNIARYTTAFTPQVRFANDANTMMLLHFDEGTGTTAHDSSGNNNNGTFNGTVTWVPDDR